jgi:hypothetical protein
MPRYSKKYKHRKLYGGSDEYQKIIDQMEDFSDITDDEQDNYEGEQYIQPHQIFAPSDEYETFPEEDVFNIASLSTPSIINIIHEQTNKILNEYPEINPQEALKFALNNIPEAPPFDIYDREVLDNPPHDPNQFVPEQQNLPDIASELLNLPEDRILHIIQNQPEIIEKIINENPVIIEEIMHKKVKVSKKAPKQIKKILSKKPKTKIELIKAIIAYKKLFPVCRITKKALNSNDSQKLNDLLFWYSSQLEQLKRMKKHVSSKNKVVKKLKKMKGGADEDFESEEALEEFIPTQEERRKLAEAFVGKVKDLPPKKELKKPGKVKAPPGLEAILMSRLPSKVQLPQEPKKFKFDISHDISPMIPPIAPPFISHERPMEQHAENLHYNINMIIDLGPKLEKLLQEKINILNEKIHKIHSLI